MSDDNSSIPCSSKSAITDGGPESGSETHDGSKFFTDLDLLVPSEYLQNIIPYKTKLVEIIVIVYLVKAPETVKCKDGSVKTVCTFLVHNNDGEVVQCVMWNEIIEKYLDLLTVQNAIHIDGASPKDVKDQFNSGTNKYEWVIQSNTVIKSLGKFVAPSETNVPETVALIDVPKHRKIIVVKGFVKTPWAVIENQLTSETTCFGSIAAEKFFLDVKISQYPSDYICQFTKGQHVQCIGSLIKNGGSFFFCVQSPNCITVVDETIASLRDLLLCRPLTTKEETKEANTNVSEQKKMKMMQLYNKK